MNRAERHRTNKPDLDSVLDRLSPSTRKTYYESMLEGFKNPDGTPLKDGNGRDVIGLIRQLLDATEDLRIHTFLVENTEKIVEDMEPDPENPKTIEELPAVMRIVQEMFEEGETDWAKMQEKLATLLAPAPGPKAQTIFALNSMIDVLAAKEAHYNALKSEFDSIRDRLDKIGTV